MIFPDGFICHLSHYPRRSEMRMWSWATWLLLACAVLCGCDDQQWLSRDRAAAKHRIVEARVELASAINDEKRLYMPLEYRLVCNQSGEYATQRIGANWITKCYKHDAPTKRNAIKRAWRQVDFDNSGEFERLMAKESAENWRDCDNTTPPDGGR